MGGRPPGPIGRTNNPIIDSGTMCRTQSSPPGPLCGQKVAYSQAEHRRQGRVWFCGRRQPPCPGHSSPNHQCADAKDIGPFHQDNTDLGKFLHGNFDVTYDPRSGILQVTLKVTYKFESGITPGSQADLKTRLRRAVQAWDNAGAYLLSRDSVLNPIIRIRFQLQEVASGAHFPIDVEKAPRREWVGYDINVWEGTTETTFIHELGHVFGNYDEYHGSGFLSWVERRMYWHDNAPLKDTAALMNSGTQFRARYFDHFARYVNQQFARVGATYEANVR